MEPTEDGKLRLVLPLGKFPVVERRNNWMRIKLPGTYAGEPFFILCTLPDNADVRVGDILTLYTEVLYATPKPTSIQ
jgi:hypothetical protein